jgi:amino acid permease
MVTIFASFTVPCDALVSMSKHNTFERCQFSVAVALIFIVLLCLWHSLFHGDLAPYARSKKNTEEANKEKSLKKNKKSKNKKVPRPVKNKKNI